MESLKMLHVAENALEMLYDVTDKEQVEVLWISAITSLRAVGHVLSKIDAVNNPEIADTVNQWWTGIKKEKASPKNNIFFDFIDRERNDTIKEFSIHFDKDYLDGVAIIDEADKATFLTELTDELLYIPMVDGPYKDEDIRDLISESIHWWYHQFQEMKLE